jgi:hypothetical protein
MMDYRKIDFGRNIDRFEREILDDFLDRLQPYIQMSTTECYYLNGIVRKVKPTRILEIGTAHGGSAALLLNATRDVVGATVVSMDYSMDCYCKPGKQTGWVIPELFPDLACRWKFYGGGVVCQYMEKAGGGGESEKFDLLLLDTVHSNPGEFLNILEALPYLKDGAVVVLHDTSMWTSFFHKNWTTCQILLSSLKGKRILFDDTASPVVPNIGAVILDTIDHDALWALFNNTALPWSYTLTESDYRILLEYYEKHYAKDLVDIFRRSADWHSRHDILSSGKRKHKKIKLFGTTIASTWKEDAYRHVNFLGVRVKLPRRQAFNAQVNTDR